jgi:hypothetical protein
MLAIIGIIALAASVATAFWIVMSKDESFE